VGRLPVASPVPLTPRALSEPGAPAHGSDVKASCAISATWRAYCTRRWFRRVLSVRAAVCIQRAVRKPRAAVWLAAACRRMMAAKKIQSTWRMYHVYAKTRCALASVSPLCGCVCVPTPAGFPTPTPPNPLLLLPFSSLLPPPHGCLPRVQLLAKVQGANLRLEAARRIQRWLRFASLARGRLLPHRLALLRARAEAAIGATVMFKATLAQRTQLVLCASFLGGECARSATGCPSPLWG
jgi:hypothetical protein